MVGVGEGRNLFPRAIQSSGCGFRLTAHTFILPPLIKKKRERRLRLVSEALDGWRLYHFDLTNHRVLPPAAVLSAM